MSFKIFFLFCFIIKTVFSNDYDYFDIKLGDVLVPQNYADGTVYICQEFELPLDNSMNYDLVKYEALIENDPMVHHMLLFGCSDIHNIQPTEPHLCAASKTSTICLNWIAQWSLGMPRTTEALPNTGFKVGRDYFKTLHLQIHLHTQTASEIESWIENSGFRVYYVKESRKYSIGNVQIGQEDFEILPNTDEKAVEGSCSSECTQKLFDQSQLDKIYISRVYLHMHGLGFKGELIHKYKDRHTNKIEERIIVQDLTYEYERPPVHEFSEPIEINAGDEILMRCYYSSKDGSHQRNHVVRWGEGAHAEMCYAFVSYFPRLQNFNKCVQYGDVDTCYYNPDN